MSANNKSGKTVDGDPLDFHPIATTDYSGLTYDPTPWNISKLGHITSTTMADPTGERREKKISALMRKHDDDFRKSIVEFIASEVEEARKAGRRDYISILVLRAACAKNRSVKRALIAAADAMEPKS